MVMYLLFGVDRYEWSRDKKDNRSMAFLYQLELAHGLKVHIVSSYRTYWHTLLPFLLNI